MGNAAPTASILGVEERLLNAELGDSSEIIRHNGWWDKLYSEGSRTIPVKDKTMNGAL